MDRKNGKQQHGKRDRLEEKVRLAKEWDTRVVIVKTPDVHRAIDVLNAIDKNLDALRKGLTIRYKAETALPLLQEFSDLTKRMSAYAAELCKVTGVQYVPPRWIEGEAAAAKSGT